MKWFIVGELIWDKCYSKDDVDATFMRCLEVLSISPFNSIPYCIIDNLTPISIIENCRMPQGFSEGNFNGRVLLFDFYLLSFQL